MEIEQQIVKVFEQANEPLRPGEVADIAGLDKKDVEKAIKKMKDSGILHSPKRCYYDIPR